MQEYLYTNRVRVGPDPHSQQMPFTSGLNKIQKKRQGISKRDIRDAFRSGKEKFEFEVIKYVKYDHDIAKLLKQGNQGDDLA